MNVTMAILYTANKLLWIHLLFYSQYLFPFIWSAHLELSWLNEIILSFGRFIFSVIFANELRKLFISADTDYVWFVSTFEFLHDDGFISSVYQIGKTPIGNKNASVVMCAKHSTWYFKLILCEKVNHSILRSISVVSKMMLCANEKIPIVYFQNGGACSERKKIGDNSKNPPSIIFLSRNNGKVLLCCWMLRSTTTTFTVLLLLLFYLVKPLQWHTK